MINIKKLVEFFFKKKKKAPPIKTEEELKFEELKSRYRLEYLDTYKRYFVQYQFNGEWWYLRQWDTDDYTFEKKRGNAIRIISPTSLNDVITRHQEWISGGRYFLPSDYE